MASMDEEQLTRIKFRRARIAKRQAQKDGSAEQMSMKRHGLPCTGMVSTVAKNSVG